MYFLILPWLSHKLHHCGYVIPGIEVMVAASIWIVTPKLIHTFFEPFFLNFFLMNKAQLLYYLFHKNFFSWLNIHILGIPNFSLKPIARKCLAILLAWSPLLTEVIMESFPKLCRYHIVVRPKQKIILAFCKV